MENSSATISITRANRETGTHNPVSPNNIS